MHKNVVGMVWLAGIVLAIVVYQLGPDRILFHSVAGIEEARDAINGVFKSFALNMFDVIRALALGLLPVFAILAALAHRRGFRVTRQVVAVAALTLILLYLPVREGYYVSSTRWIIAFFVVAIGCLSVSRMLTRPMIPQGWGPRG